MADFPRLTGPLGEAERIMTICNACRYCEGICAVFPAMARQRSFNVHDLRYLANLCHDCGACYDDCQFTPPHQFAVNVPVTMAQVRGDSYRAFAWPRPLGNLFDRNGIVLGAATAIAVAALLIVLGVWNGSESFFGVHTGPGAFYQLMPHGTMVSVFGAAFGYAAVAIGASVRRSFAEMNPARTQALRANPWRDALRVAARDAAKLRYLDGGGAGCASLADSSKDVRRLFHHLTTTGFGLCFAATCIATVYHYLLGREAPYLWQELPVLLGIVGGVGLLIGPAGLLVAKRRRDTALRDPSQTGMELGFVWMLLMTSATGMLLLLGRATPALGTLLAVHLGVVFSLFITLPYSKFVHGLYRLVALYRYARDDAGE